MQVSQGLSVERHRGLLGLAVCAVMFLVVLVVPAPIALADTFDDACAAPTIVDTGGNATYNLSSGQVLFIDAGTYTGTINSFPAGAVICVNNGGTFQPSALNGSVAGSVFVRGGAVFPGDGLSAGFLLDNYGTVSFPSSLNANGAIQLINRPSGTVTTSGANWQGALDNQGEMTIGSLNVNSGDVSNSGQLTITSSANLSGGLTNTGRVDFGAGVNLNSDASFTNSCTVTVAGDVQANPPGMTNSGQWLIAGTLTMNGSASLDLDGVATMNNLQLNGSVTGSGAMRIEGTSTQNGGSTVTGDPEINVYDLTQTAPPAFFDIQNGTVTGGVRTPFDVPDPDVSPATCAPEPPTPEADVSITKTGPAAALVGDSATYTITVTNNGPDMAEGVLLHELHDPSYTVTSVTTGGHLVGRSAFLAVGDLAPGSSVVLVATGFYTLTGSFEDVVSASAGTPDPDPSDNEAELSTTVQNRPPDVEDLEVVTNAFTPVSGQIEWSDPDTGQTVTFAPDAIQIQQLSPVSPDGSFTYTPSGTFAGIEIFMALGCDDGVPELCEAAEIEVVVFPVAEDDVVEVGTGSGVTIEIAVNDSGGTDPPSIVMSPSGGTAVVDGSGFLYTPDPGFVGTDSFIYEICAPDEPDLCDQATVTIDVQQVVTTTVPAVTTTSPTGGPTTTDPGAGSSTTAFVGDLPLTGAEIATFGGMGLAALAMGGVLVVSARGRRHGGRHRRRASG
jgi:uncharacterized repeat protein (TIGR01451 family)